MSVTSSITKQSFFINYMRPESTKTTKQTFSSIRSDISDEDFLSFANSTANILVSSEIKSFKQTTVEIFDDGL